MWLPQYGAAERLKLPCFAAVDAAKTETIEAQIASAQTQCAMCANAMMAQHEHGGR